MFQKEVVGGKSVYVVNKHNECLVPWREIKGQSDSPHYLVTFDSHRDCEEAFSLDWAKNNKHPLSLEPAVVCDGVSKHAMNMTCKMSKAGIQEWEGYVSRLKNTEQIDCGLRTGVLCEVFLVTHDTQTLPPLIPTASRVHIAGRTNGNSSSAGEYFDQALECPFLLSRLECCLGKSSAIQDIDRLCDTAFVLDFDLDYLLTQAAVAPKEREILGRLIRKSKAITIARETVHLKCEQEKWGLPTLTADSQEAALKGLIKEFEN